MLLSRVHHLHLLWGDVGHREVLTWDRLGPNPRSQSYLQNPYYFMFAALAKPDEDVELHWLKVCICLFRSCSRFFVPLGGSR